MQHTELDYRPSMEKGLLKVTFWRYRLPGNHTEKISEGAVLWEFSKVLSWVDYASIIVPNWCVNVWCIVCFQQNQATLMNFHDGYFFYHYNPGYTVFLSL